MQQSNYSHWEDAGQSSGHVQRLLEVSDVPRLQRVITCQNKVTTVTKSMENTTNITGIIITMIIIIVNIAVVIRDNRRCFCEPRW